MQARFNRKPYKKYWAQSSYSDFSTKSSNPKLGEAFKAFEKIFVNKILLSPIREDIKCPKALPRWQIGLQRKFAVGVRASEPRVVRLLGGLGFRV